MPKNDKAQQALNVYRASLESAVGYSDVYEFSLTPLDHVGLPLWSVALIPPDGALSDGFGYGPTLTAAQASAWGETVEWYWAREALRTIPRRQGSIRELQHDGLPVLDPLTLCVDAGKPYSPDLSLLWVEARRYPGHDPVWVPIEAVAPRYADIGAGVQQTDFLFTPITNGLGAGPTFEHALAHGIMEQLQRDGNSVNYRALDQGVVVELDDVRDAETLALLQQLDDAGIDITVKLAATDFGITNVYVVGADRDIARAPHPISLSACGEAAHPDRERALAKALREFVSARARKAFNHGPLDLARKVAPAGYLQAFGEPALRSEDPRALNEMRRWVSLDVQQFYDLIHDPIFIERERVRFGDLPTVVPEAVENPADLLDLLTERLGREGLEVIYAPFTPPGAPAAVLKVIVPGLEVETMTYHRIGKRNLERLLARQSPIVGVGDAPSGTKRILLPPKAEAELGGAAWLDPQAVDRAMGNLYALYREPGRHVIGILDKQGQHA
jgi:ribosomal protein S12 methylthiotransferase accessory factor